MAPKRTVAGLENNDALALTPSALLRRPAQQGPQPGAVLGFWLRWAGTPVKSLVGLFRMPWPPRLALRPRAGKGRAA